MILLSQHITKTSQRKDSPEAAVMSDAYRHHIEVVFSAIISELNVSLTDIISTRRDRRFARARWWIMHFLTTRYGWTMSQIALVLGRRDRTTVVHGLREIRHLLSGRLSGEESRLAECIERIERDGGDKSLALEILSALGSAEEK